jgi:subtilisin family serine protease
MDGHTARITRGADLAVSKGIAVFNSAGNAGFNSDHNTIAAPADGDSVITIGSVTIDGLRSGFSSVGNTVDGRTKPDLMARGSSVISASPSSNSSYTYTSGTSLSCPIAAGAGALLLQARPHLTPIQLRDALKANATNSNSPNREYGWGIIKLLDAINNTPSSNKDEEPAAPGTFVLKGNYPNPFNPSTKIRFEVKETIDLKLEVYNASGELTAVIADQTFYAGVYEYNFNAQGLSSGVYLVRLSNLSENKMLKITLLK